VLAESLDYRATLNAVAQLITPALADWCSVIVINRDGDFETVAVAHAGPDGLRLAREFVDRYPERKDANFGAPKVARTGISELYAEFTPDMLTAVAQDEEHLGLLRALDMRSVLVVPMQAHGRSLGALTLIGSGSVCTFSASDLPIAEELARRSALAIENAELFRAAAAASRAKSEFLASMSHELRTPLNAVLGYTQLLADGITGPVSPAQQEQLMRIRASAGHLLGLIDEVLTYSRLEAGREQISFHDVDVATVLEEAASLVRPMAGAKRLPLVIEPLDGPLMLQTDLLKLRQILVNLSPTR
jgi:signal transduction histidine kinase